MKQVYCLLLLVGWGLTGMAQQNRASDSTATAKALKELAAIAKNVDFTDPKVQKLGYFYKAAPYIVYRGNDDKRKWKTFCNYQLKEDKEGVDNVCERINRTINQSKGYTILKYTTDKESEGTWHVLELTYTVKNHTRNAVFAFLKIGKRLGLGDIDE